VLVTIYIGIIALAVLLYPFQKHIEHFWDVRPNRAGNVASVGKVTNTNG